MTIANTNVKSNFPGNGITREFALGFSFDPNVSSLYIFVKHQDDTTEDITTNYSYSNGVLTYPTVASGLDPLPAGDILFVSRETALTQDINLVQQGPLDAETLEGGYDKDRLIDQELKEELGRAIKYPVGFEGNTDAQSYVDTINSSISIATSSASQAAASATSAANSATAAEASATQAASSASAALGSQNAAATSATTASRDAADVIAAYNTITDWIDFVEQLEDGDVKVYVVGTSTETYDGSTTVFPVENEFEVPILVFVNGLLKEETTDYVADKEENTITFNNALTTGDRVNIVSEISIVSLETSSAISTAINNHNTSSSAHNNIASTVSDLSSTVSGLSSTVSGLSSDLSGLTTTVSGKVAKAGDTMTGTLTISKDTEHLIAKDTNLDRNVTPSSNITGGYYSIFDKNNNLQARLYSANLGGGYNTVAIQAWSNTTSNIAKEIGVAVNKEGTKAFGFAPASDVAGSILTTTAISKSGNGYVKLGNGLIIQWGSYGAIGTDSLGTVTFPTPFGSTNYGIVFSTYFTQAVNNFINIPVSPKTASKTTTNIVVINDGYAVVGGMFVAIGY